MLTLIAALILLVLMAKFFPGALRGIVLIIILAIVALMGLGHGS
jgi:hypothetical protein